MALAAAQRDPDHLRNLHRTPLLRPSAFAVDAWWAHDGSPDRRRVDGRDDPVHIAMRCGVWEGHHIRHALEVVVEQGCLLAERVVGTVGDGQDARARGVDVETRSAALLQSRKDAFRSA